MGRRRLLLISTAIAAALVALIVFGLAADHSGPVGRRAPALPREHLAGAPVTLDRLLSEAHGRATLITFWASWCGPCATEAQALESFSRSPAGRGRLVAVDWSDALSGARSFVARHAWTFPVLRDAEGTVGNEYRLTGLPTTFVLDASGHIRSELRGPQNAGTLKRAMASIRPG
ncbi:MAG: cytochrome c biosis protein CcmG, thiol:disulfide interchange protein DsbE [Solirubrobacteraceae bacterium]|jgi:thiol-disulfide isomerase/thioredoxin|nr:cytochrome c biosis protein CcmG, thiol:disulfide interchange protein DsbE [Solirubrobacteraceae bacterium]MEA2334928.1 cytochrome c biosis protein CcmG, thiol:disulfide interchange protein DsbE [Solirubrobacteraceae bacterium]